MLTENEQLKNWIWAAKVIFLAGLWFSVFYIAEHDPKMATLENFVQDIEAQESWASGGNSLRRIAFLGCAGLGVLGLMMGQWHLFRWNAPMVLLVIYLAWTAASVLWSIDAGASVRRYILMICCVIGCIGMSRFLTMEQVLLSTILMILGWLFVGVSVEILVGAFRPHQGDYRFAGTLHPNLQAANLAILCIASFTMAQKRPKFNWLFYGIIAVGGLFLVLTKCRSGTALFPASLMAVWFATQPLKQITLGSIIGLWVVSTSVFGFMVIGFDPIQEYSELLLLGRSEETGSSLTGRLPLWQDLSSYIAIRPWQGYGFGAFWTPRHIYDVAVGQQWVISEAHSSYVDTALQLGLVGALLMVSVAVSTLSFAIAHFRRTGQAEFIFVIGAVVFCLARGFTESGLSGPSGFTSPLFVMMAAHSWSASSQTDAEEISTVPNPQPPSPEVGVV